MRRSYYILIAALLLVLASGCAFSGNLDLRIDVPPLLASPAP